MNRMRNINTVYIVCLSMAIFATVGLIGTIVLVFVGVDAGAVGIVSGLTGTAIGSLASLLASTSAAPKINGNGNGQEPYVEPIQQ